MRALYSLAVYLLTPLLLLHFALRGSRHPGYRQRWGERFGCYRHTPATGGIVVHAASVGEVNAAAPLIRALLQRFTDRPLTVTCLTPTGSERVRALFGDTVFHVYAPLDLPGAVGRFLDRLQPRLVVVMETEIWPNLFVAVADRRVPLLMANARISATSLRGYRRIHRLTRTALSSAASIAARSESDARRLCEIGAPPDRVTVVGNLKFDLALQPELDERGRVLRTGWGDGRPVLVAGSTHADDEAPVLTAFRRVLATWPDALLVLVPRHPERFAPAAESARAARLETRRLSVDGSGAPPAQCLVVDTMGQLLHYYAACDVAFVGGSFARIGGHNVLEPAALGRPVLAGPHTFDVQDIMQPLLDCGGAWRVADAAALAEATDRLFGDAALRARMGDAGAALVRRRRGALARTLDMAAELLGAEPARSLTPAAD